MTQYSVTAVEREAQLRHERHLNHPTHRPLSHNYEFVGLRGEDDFAREFGCEVDLSAKPGGDGGRDFGLAAIGYGHVVIDVKTARKPKHLLVETGKVKLLTVYVLAGYEDVHDTVMLVGWEWGWKVMTAPTRQFGYSVVNHFIPARELRPIPELRRRVWRDA
jgi:hypothetical protein